MKALDELNRSVICKSINGSIFITKSGVFVELLIRFYELPKTSMKKIVSDQIFVVNSFEINSTVEKSMVNLKKNRKMFAFLNFENEL